MSDSGFRTLQISRNPIPMLTTGTFAMKLIHATSRRPMKVKLIAFENGLVSMGLRRISSFTKQFYDDVETFFYDGEGNSAFIKNMFFQKKKALPLQS